MKSMRFLCLVLSFLLVFCACGQENAQQETEAPQRALELTVTQNLDINQDFSLPYHDPLEYNGLTFIGVTATVTRDGEEISLDTALEEGTISITDIFIQALTDAQNGICQQSQQSQNGLAAYTFHYDDFALYITHDVYEVPDGNQYFIRYLAVCYPSRVPESLKGILWREGTGRLDGEVWGITLDVSDVTPTGATVTVTHADGQQIGIPHIQDYAIIGENNTVGYVGKVENFDVPLNVDGTTQFQLDWEELYGQLQPGDYALTFRIYDIYEESDVHPLMRNFEDMVFMTTHFTVS